MLAEV